MRFARLGRPAGTPESNAEAPRALTPRTETGECHSYKANAESFEGLPPRYRFRHTFRQMIEFVVHSFAFSLFLSFFVRSTAYEA